MAFLGLVADRCLCGESLQGPSWTKLHTHTVSGQADEDGLDLTSPYVKLLLLSCDWLTAGVSVGKVPLQRTFRGITKHMDN